jgi:hypothetical protein
MFKLIRLMIFVLLAFVAGQFYERSQNSECCATLGGDMDAGLCKGIPK